jgi:quercetin dioxygenase-like cupin family protein
MSSVQRIDLQCKVGDSRTCVWQGEGLQVMRVRLTPGEALPPHNANANVVLIPLQGELRFSNGKGEQHEWGVGEALAVAYDTPMDVLNTSDADAVFLIVKTPPQG